MVMDRFGNNPGHGAGAPPFDGKPETIGLFGGTFNPIHYGHLRAAEEIRESFHLKKIVFVPAHIPPHKEVQELVDPDHRLRMVELAIHGNSAYEFSDFEIKRDQTSYSILTVEHFLAECNGSVLLYFLMGMDSFGEITTWKDFVRLFSLVNFIVFTRPGYPKKEISAILPVDVADDFHYHADENCYRHSSDHTVHFYEGTLIDISSRGIRSRLKQGRSIRYLVPSAVADYIENNKLYAR